MHTQSGFSRNLICYFLVALFSHLIFSNGLYGSELKQISNEKFDSKVKYELSVKDDLITLNAKDAFLKKILEDIGQKMNIDVFARIPADDKITIQFADLTLEDALKKFKTNYAFVTDSKDKNGNIKRIVVVPEGQQAHLFLKDTKNVEAKSKGGIAQEKTSKPEPFKFEFDPSKFSEKNQ